MKPLVSLTAGRRFLRLSVSVVAGALALQFVTACDRRLGPQITSTETSAQSDQDKEKRRREIWNKITPLLAEAQEQMFQLANQSIVHLQKMLDEKKAGATGFAEEVISLHSKWILAKSKLPGTDHDAHAKYVEQEFERFLFSESEVRQMVAAAVTQYLDGVREIEAQLLTKARLDLADLPTTVVDNLTAEQMLLASFETALGSAREEVSRGISVNTAAFGGSLVLSVIVDRVIAATLTRLAVSGGLLGVGAGSTVCTVGVGFVVMLGVDWVVDKVTNPAGKIASDICGSIDQLKQALCVDGAEDGGLTAELANIACERAAVQTEVLQQFVNNLP